MLYSPVMFYHCISASGQQAADLYSFPTSRAIQQSTVSSQLCKSLESLGHLCALYVSFLEWHFLGVTKYTEIQSNACIVRNHDCCISSTLFIGWGFAWSAESYQLVAMASVRGACNAKVPVYHSRQICGQIPGGFNCFRVTFPVGGILQFLVLAS